MRYSINWLPHATFRPIDTVEYMIHNLGTDVCYYGGAVHIQQGVSFREFSEPKNSSMFEE